MRKREREKDLDNFTAANQLNTQFESLGTLHEHGRARFDDIWTVFFPFLYPESCSQFDFLKKQRENEESMF